MTTPFDRALEAHAIRNAAAAFALSQGQPGTSEYRAAGIRFRQKVRTAEDLRRWRPGADDPGQDPLVRDVLDAAVEHAVYIDAADMANAQRCEPGSQALRLVAHHGFSAEFLDFFEIVDDTTTACGKALKDGSPMLISDITRSPVFAGTRGLQVMLAAGSRAVASVPVRSPTGQIMAMISTHHAHTTTWTDARLLALHDLSQSAGHLLHHLLRDR